MSLAGEFHSVSANCWQLLTSYKYLSFLQARIQNLLAKQHHSVSAFPTPLFTLSQRVWFFPLLLCPTPGWNVYWNGKFETKMLVFSFSSNGPFSASSPMLSAPKRIGTFSGNLVVCLLPSGLAFPCCVLK